MAILVNYAALQQAASEVNSVKNKFTDEMNSLKQIVEATTQNDWKGPDADLFVANTKAKILKLNDQYNEFLTNLMNVINENHDKFKETQQRNISMQEE